MKNPLPNENSSNEPSAPYSQEIGFVSASTPQINQHTPPPGYSIGQAEYQQSDPPPPSYQEALSYQTPAAPYQPNVFPKAPGGPSNAQATPTPYPPAPQPFNNQSGNPSHATYIIHASQPTPNVILAGNCAHCLTGQVVTETDICCLLCLILLAIFTFPFGLALLCCIPCTNRRRCLRCRRLN